MSHRQSYSDKEQEAPRRRIRPGMAVLWCLIILLIIGALFWLIFRKKGNFTRAELADSYEAAISSHSQIAPFAGGFLRYSADGAGFISPGGREMWNINYSMNAPRFVAQGDYGLLADMAGLSAVVFDKEGECGRFSTADPIIGAVISSQGVTAVALERDLNSLVCFYDRQGSRLDIEISLEMSISGYPMAMAISPDGSGLALSMVSSQSGGVGSQLVFYNFTVGRSETNRLIGYFNYEGALLTQIDYLSEKRVAAVCDDRLDIYSLDRENKPELKETVLFPGELSRYSQGYGHEAFLAQETGSGNMTLYVYDNNGRLSFSEALEGECRRLLLGKELVLVMTDRGVKIYTYSGASYFSGSLPQASSWLFLQGRQLIQFENDRINLYRFR